MQIKSEWLPHQMTVVCLRIGYLLLYAPIDLSGCGAYDGTSPFLSIPVNKNTVNILFIFMLVNCVL